MILGVNGRFLGARATGVQRFAAEIAARMWGHVERAVLLLPAGVDAPADLPAHVRVSRGRRKGPLWERMELPRQAREAGCDVVLHLANTAPRGGPPHVVVVHDAEPLLHPERFAPAFAAWYRFVVAPAVREAAAVLSVSSAAARAVAGALALDATRIGVVDQGAAPLDRPASPDAVAAARRRYALSGPYVLAVGGADPRKNVGFLREVVARAPTAVQLAVVDGSEARVFAGGALAARAPGEVRLGRVDDETLRALYTGASALLFPSLSEGFGRPPLEALACGTPTIVAPYEAAEEVLGDAVERIPLDADRWAAALEAILSDSEPRGEARRARGRAQAARHSWDAGVLTVLAACREAAGETAAPRGSARTVRAPAEAALPSRPRVPGPTPFARARVALVHDWLTGMRGGERVLEALLDLFPRADIFTLVRVPGSTSPAIEGRRIHTSFIQRLPAAERRYRSYLPLFPRAIESFDLRGYDLVVSSSHCVAKGAIAPHGVPHVSYCHTPMRYIWDQADAYLAPGRASPLVRAVGPAVASTLRRWDVESSARVDRFLANSAFVQGRIREYWGRPSEVVHPPVDVERFVRAAEREDFYLMVSALVPYKLVDVAVEAFRRLGRPFVVVGSGPDRARLEAAAGPRTRFTGWVSEQEVERLMSRCRALIMPGVEDFGIAPVEAQAAGAPVIALGQGGVLETVVGGEGDDATGVFYASPTAESLAEAVVAFERRAFDPAALRRSALRFTRERFLEGMASEVARALAAEPGTRAGASG